MKNTKLGRLTPIENKELKGHESKNYVRVWVEDLDGNNERPLLLTPKELETIEKRTNKHKEDWGKRGVIQDFFD